MYNSSYVSFGTLDASRIGGGVALDRRSTISARLPPVESTKSRYSPRIASSNDLPCVCIITAEQLS